MAHIDLSIIIPTYNRKILLLKVFSSLRHLQHEPGEIELIVVDDGSTDGTASALEHEPLPFPVKIIRHEQSRGPAIARNHGATEAQGEILGFLDSDIVVHPKWWVEAKPHFQNQLIAGVEGATAPPDHATAPTPFTHIVSNTKGGNYLTCNMFYRKQKFHQVGGFDERFIRANREDSDIAFSILEDGNQIVFEPQCKVEHPLFISSVWVYFKEAKFGIHEALLRRKHPQLYKKYLKWIDGRAFPIFYWGMFFGLPGLGLAIAWQHPLLGLLCAGGFGLGWVGAVYAVCRKRKTRLRDLIVLGLQYSLIPWVRLFWVLLGEWKHRNIRPNQIKIIKK